MRFQILAVSLLGLVAVAGCNPAVETADTDAQPAASSIPADATTVSFNVPDMHCPHGCVGRVKEVLAGTEGVKACDVDFDNKLAIVAIDEVEFDKDKALANLEEAGFPGTVQ